MHQLTSHSLRQFHALLGGSSLHMLYDGKPLQYEACKQPRFIALTLLFVFGSLSHKVAQPLHIELSAVKHLRMIELDDK